MFGNPVLFALMTYGLTIVIALMVAGIIAIIHKAVQSGGQKASPKINGEK
ncbi:hypothetical protein ACFLV1_02290 [Chloroflexota bacterium]